MTGNPIWLTSWKHVGALRNYRAGLDQSGLVNHQMAYDAVLRNLEIIGEAAKRIPPEVRVKMLKIEWTKDRRNA